MNISSSKSNTSKVRKRSLTSSMKSIDSGIYSSNDSPPLFELNGPPKKYMGSPRSCYFNTVDNSGLTGMSNILLDKYKAVRNIKALYPWQEEFLNDPRIIRGENALLTAQTGGGKTLIAEILMLREIFNRNCSAIFVLPLVALVQEKILAFKALADAFAVRIEEYAAHKGRIPPIKRQDHRSLFVCTIEKASLLINALMEKNELKTVGLLVLDEVHMIGESGRGANLECLIAKYAAAHPKGQIVAMSATIGNADELAKFLNGFHYHNSNRPVELVQYLTNGKMVYKVTKHEILDEDRMLQSRANNDPDGVIELTMEIVPKHSVLIFCSSRQACENLALLLAEEATNEFKSHKKEERARIVEELKAETDGQTPQVLKNVLRCGIAYHHAGLMTCERQVIESAFHSGAISIVCATSTLAAGVNLPARRVIIRSPKVGINFMTKSQFLQMAGRAGRAGYDDIGECFVIANQGRERIMEIILNEPIPNCMSQLKENLDAFILDLIGLGFTKKADLQKIVRSSLLGVQNENVDEFFDEAINHLVDQKFLIPMNTNDGSYGLDMYGKGKFHSGLSPQEIPDLVNHLNKHFVQGITFKTRFNLIYICIPFDVRVTIHWEVYRAQYMKLEACDRRMFGPHDEVERNIFKHQQGALPTQREARLYAALIINRLCKYGMTSLYDNSRTFKVAVGWIQQTYDAMCHRAQALGRFSEHIQDMWALKGLLPELVSYMRDAGNEEIAQLMKIDGITRSMAHKLTKTKYNTIGALAKVTADELRKEFDGRLRKNLAEKIIFNAKCELRDAIDEKKEELQAIGADLTTL